jgi:hypothetical protein
MTATWETPAVSISAGTCNCCGGIEAATPEEVANRPALPALRYRVGTHATFLRSMLARLSSHALPDGTRPLATLATRDPQDPAVALLDAWATVADVLTFYQERIANEGFLRTAEERRSVIELARLIGYRVRPGVAATAWLALEFENGYSTRLDPHEVRAQSVPDPGESAQVFENLEPIAARAAWNRMRPRLTRPQSWHLGPEHDGVADLHIWIKGVTTDLRRHDVILVTWGEAQGLFHVERVERDAVADRTLVVFEETAEQALGPVLQQVAAAVGRVADAFTGAGALRVYRVAGTATAKRVASRVRNVRVALNGAARSGRIPRTQIAENLGGLLVEKQHAGIRGYENLEPWLAKLVPALRLAVLPLVRIGARRRAKSSVPPVHDLPVDPLDAAVQALAMPPSRPPHSPRTINRDLGRLFEKGGDTTLQLVAGTSPDLARALPALLGAGAPPQEAFAAYVFRAKARAFGHNAPPRPVQYPDETTPYRSFNYFTRYGEWQPDDPMGLLHPLQNGGGNENGNGNGNGGGELHSADTEATPLHQAPKTLYLDGEYKIAADGWIVLETKGRTTARTTTAIDLSDQERVRGVEQTSLAAYGMSGKATRIDLAEMDDVWLQVDGSDFSTVRGTVIHCESEKLELAEEPVVDPIAAGDEGTRIELDGIYSSLETGRWIIVSGERDDIPGPDGAPAPGIVASELAMIAGVWHGADDDEVPNANHTFITLARDLAYSYRRESISIYGNVVKASHGESRTETLGSGDASKPFQSFPLKQTPVTYTSAPTPSGVESSLSIYVNDLRWPEAESLAVLTGGARGFVAKTEDAGATTIVFGNGKSGARLPTGVANVRAIYRNGIGKGANVREGQISQLVSRPLGLKGVVNPLRASGGADREDHDTARANAPRAVVALDRLVSASDHADFARSFAGIGKAVATVLTEGARRWVHVTVAGADDAPIDETGDLFRNLRHALSAHGERGRPVVVQVRELLRLAVAANVRVLPDRIWEDVAARIEASLRERFGFARRALGEDVARSEVIAAIQSVDGVDYVDLDVLAGIPETRLETDADGGTIRRLLTPDELAQYAPGFVQDQSGLAAERVRAGFASVEGGAMRPAQLAYLLPKVPEMLVLNQIRDADGND